MSNYTVTFDGAAKDALPSGNPAKLVKGADLDVEFDNIATAVATKADRVSPVVSGDLAGLDANGDLTDSGILVSGGSIQSPSIQTPTITAPTINGSALNASGSELDRLDGVTDGTGAANKALVLDVNGYITSGVGLLRADRLDGSLVIRHKNIDTVQMLKRQYLVDSTYYAGSPGDLAGATPTTSNGLAGPQFSYTPVSDNSIIHIQITCNIAQILGKVGVGLFAGSTRIAFQPAGYVDNSVDAITGCTIIAAVSNTSTATRTYRLYGYNLTDTNTLYFNRDPNGTNYGGTLAARVLFEEFANNY